MHIAHIKIFTFKEKSNMIIIRIEKLGLITIYQTMCDSTSDLKLLLTR